MAKPAWTLTTEVAVELLSVPSHTHGKGGTTYLAYDHVVAAVSDVETRRESPERLAAQVADLLGRGGESAEALKEALSVAGITLAGVEA